MIKLDVARRGGSACARGRRSYAYKYACDAYVVHAWDTRALVKLPLGGTVCLPGCKGSREALYYAKTRAFASFYAMISRAHAARAVT